MEKNGLLAARKFRLFRVPDRYKLVADSWAGLVGAAFNARNMAATDRIVVECARRKASLLVLAD